MEKAQLLGVWVIGIGIIIAVLLVSGYMETDSIIGQILYGRPDLESIERFVGVEEGDSIRFYFIFNDRLGHDGMAIVVISDDLDNNIYNSQFDVEAYDFSEYEFNTTEEGTGMAYEWEVPYSDIETGVSSIGYVHLKFITTGGRQFDADAYLFSIPSGADQAEEANENEYVQSAKTSGEHITYNDLRVTLVRHGYYTYGVWDENVTGYRADIKAENLGNESKSLVTYRASLISGSSQYDTAYGSTFDGSSIPPNETREGYMIFKDVPGPEDLSGNTILFIGEFWTGLGATVVYMFTV